MAKTPNFLVKFLYMPTIAFHISVAQGLLLVQFLLKFFLQIGIQFLDTPHKKE
ncbi:Uncharacterised protein [Streptococcus pneumoniae]|nr:Uncharacterised protein [Streptococcus pneumoniae]